MGELLVSRLESYLKSPKETVIMPETYCFLFSYSFVLYSLTMQWSKLGYQKKLLPSANIEATFNKRHTGFYSQLFHDLAKTGFQPFLIFSGSITCSGKLILSFLKFCCCKATISVFIYFSLYGFHWSEVSGMMLNTFFIFMTCSYIAVQSDCHDLKSHQGLWEYAYLSHLI